MAEGAQRVNSIIDVNPLDLPSLPLELRRQLPDCVSIYFVIDKDDVILYVGQSISLAQRWMAHHCTKQLQGIENVRIAWLEVSEKALLDDIEQACIDYFGPSLNGTPCDRDEEFTRFHVRMPSDLHEELIIVSDEEGRSLNAQIVYLLRQGIARYKKNKHRSE